MNRSELEQLIENVIHNVRKEQEDRKTRELLVKAKQGWKKLKKDLWNE